MYSNDITHCGSGALQCEKYSGISADIVCNRGLNPSKGEIRDRCGSGKETSERTEERGKVFPSAAGDVRERMPKDHRGGSFTTNHQKVHEDQGAKECDHGLADACHRLAHRQGSRSSR